MGQVSRVTKTWPVNEEAVAKKSAGQAARANRVRVGKIQEDDNSTLGQGRQVDRGDKCPDR